MSTYISTNIKFLRNKLGMTQTDLAEKLGKTSAAISDYEKGKSVPPLEVAFKISKLFKISIDDLAKKNLQRDDILLQEGISAVEEPDYKAKYAENQKKLEEKLKTLERLNELQGQRLSDLEWMIKKHAPELAKEIGLLDKRN
jgi:transcriptional regulator with XRE-family HTH domain